MLERLVAVAIVLVAVFFTARSLWRNLHGGSDSGCGGCRGCGSDSTCGESSESHAAHPKGR